MLLEKLYHGRLRVWVLLWMFAVQTVVSVMFLAVGWNYDTDVTIFFRNNFLHSFLVHCGVTTGGTISDIHICVQMIKAVFQKYSLKRFLCHTSYLAVACKTGNLLDSRSIVMDTGMCVSSQYTMLTLFFACLVISGMEILTEWWSIIIILMSSIGLRNTSPVSLSVITTIPSLTDSSFAVSIIKVCFAIFCEVTKNKRGKIYVLQKKVAFFCRTTIIFNYFCIRSY